MNAESAYLFRHALLRDAAYQLQLPGDRAKLHALAFAVLEEMAGGRAPAPAPPDWERGATFLPHPTDSFAEELAEHARRSQDLDSLDAPRLLASRTLYLRRAAEHAARSFEMNSSARLWLEHAGLVTGPLRSESQCHAALALLRGGQPKIAESLLESALARFREAGDRQGEGFVVGTLGGLHLEIGALGKAEQFIGQALSLHRELGNRRLEGIELGKLANLYLDAGRYEEAEKTCRQALTTYRQSGDRRSEGISLASLAILAEIAGQAKQAERLCDQALAIDREVGNRRSEGIVLGNLAGLYLRTGRHEQAERTHLQALAIHREVRDKRSEGIALGCLAILYRKSARIAEAGRNLEQALAIHRESRNARSEGADLCQYALVQLAKVEPDLALENWRKGSALLRELGDTPQLEHEIAEMRLACDAAGVPPFDGPTG